MTAGRPFRLTDERGVAEVGTRSAGGSEPVLERRTSGVVRLREADGSTVDGLLTGLRSVGPNGPAVRATIELIVEGWRFVFTIEDEERSALRERAGQAGGAAGHHGEVVVRSVIPGRVVSVAVAEGDVVEAGDRLLVVEAMKMQNEIRAPHGGRIVRIGVTEGWTVEVGSVLVVLG
jgi:biotin carboxyl carrier protein